MIPKPLRQFVIDLIDATDKNVISWSEGVANGAFFCSRKSYTINISFFFDQDEGISYYNMTIGGDKSASFVVASYEHADYKVMSDLHSSVEINAGNLGSIGEDFFS